MRTKFIVVLGSLMSGLGKGVTTASILRMLDFYRYKVLPIKFDGYLNYDCGTMNPYRHGEVFVLDDKGEVDMDFGIYERFLEKDLNSSLSITGGKLFSLVINKERKGEYLGRDVQIIPHLTDEIISLVEKVAIKNDLDALVIEVGGTVGDLENNYFIEAMRQLALKRDVVFVNVTYVPKLSVVGEQKTKPAQLGFRNLMQTGIKPNFIICRSNDQIEDETKAKIALFANLNKNKIYDNHDVDSIYEVPINLMKQGFDRVLIETLGLEKREIDRKVVREWTETVNRVIKPKKYVNIAIVGKYTHLKDAYVSVKEALTHGGAALDCGINIKWIESTDVEKEGGEILLENLDGIVVPGGFGSRGTEGKINAIRYAREHKIPYLGLCLGMQLMAVEFARNICNMKGANSSEFDKNAKYKIIDLMISQKEIKNKGGTMRLGDWETKIIEKDSIAHKAYAGNVAHERHRHRYELNNKYRKALQEKGLIVSGVTKDNKLVEFIEWKDSFGIGTQAHPELKSKLNKPAPLFKSFIEACISKKSGKE